jgi:prolipoprotein diacylglyceryltransferase
MRGSAIVGAVLVILGLFFLYELRDPLVQFIVIVLEAVGIVIALVLIAIGLALIFWRPRRFWYRVEETAT